MNRRFRRPLAVLTVMAAVLTACADDATDDAVEEEATAEEEPAEEEPEEDPEEEPEEEPEPTEEEPEGTPGPTGVVFVIDEDQVAGAVAEVEAETGVTPVSGEIDGAAYIASYPEDWNGDLVVYAHGYRGEGPELTVDPPPAYQFLTSQGYAWAASSYARNSYDPGIGVVDTIALTQFVEGELEANYGEPVDKTFIAGFSMGGHVTAAAIEQQPELYDGALPACGVLGDVELFDYFLDYNVAAAALAGVEATFPDTDWTSDEGAQIRPALSLYDEEGSNPASWGIDGSPLVAAAGTDLLDGPGEDLKAMVEQITGGDRGGLFDVAWDFWHSPLVEGGNFFFNLYETTSASSQLFGNIVGNADRDYAAQYGLDIDADVLRVTAEPLLRDPATPGLPAPIITGSPQVPVLSIHTTGDLFVPFHMEQIYAQEVAANGLSDNLVQRAIRDVGHCSFTADELVQSYTDLFTWVETGERPAGDDVIADATSPTLGCDWTGGEGGSGFRQAIPPCP